MNTGFITILALLFAGLLALRIAFLLILRRSETPRRPAKPRWPDATVIRTRDTTDPDT